MIAKLTGKISDNFSDYLIVDVGGVGYKVEGRFLGLEINKTVTFFIYTHVRENEIRLFGFTEVEQLQLFEKLLTVSGVGPKTALTAISLLGVAAIVNAVNSGKPELIKTNGVGLKTAQRIVIELKSKIAGFRIKFDPQLAIKRTKLLELEQALLDLGYSKSEIEKATTGLDLENTDLQNLLKTALKILQN